MDIQSDLVTLLERGGVFYNISGTSVHEVLSDMTATVPVPESIEAAALLKAITEREELMPTAIGNGIALPHPRSPLITDPKEQRISICFLEQAVDWNALDSVPVRILILIISASPKLHLGTLSKLSFLCRQESFRSLLENRSSREELCDAIREAERAWS